MRYSRIQADPIITDENQLILAAQKGDHEAFNELVLIYQDAVYNLAYRILGEPNSADDVTQNTFITAFRSLAGFRNGSFRSWLFRIATNSCYDDLRKRGRHPSLSIDFADEMEERSFWPYASSKPENSPEQIYLRHELEQTIQQAMNALKPEQRMVVILVDLQDMDYQETAQALRIPVGTVKSRLARGRERLQQILIHQESDPGSVSSATERAGGRQIILPRRSSLC
jgi:RNA polymerase sigma factor (sigma-70 family)